VYFHLQPPNALLGDVNADLIATYQAIKLDWRSLERSLRYRQRRHRENTEYYYWLRSRSPRELTQRDLPGMNESDRSRGCARSRCIGPSFIRLALRRTKHAYAR
jgi:site-specific DNA-adenine methylase